LNPAIQLGIDNRVGSLEVGKDADIAIFDNHPLSIYAIPQFTLVDGVVKFDRKNDKTDMRIIANPDDKVNSSFTEFHTHDDRCMEGVTEFLFRVHSHK
jgi:urease alpha subunit